MENKTENLTIEKKLRKILCEGNVIYKKQALLKLGVSDRAFRYAMSSIAKELPLIALSHDRGYRLATNSVEDIEDIQHQINEFSSRQRKLEERKAPLIKLLNKIIIK